MYKNSQTWYPHLGTPPRLLQNVGESTFEEILELPESSWVQNSFFSFFIDNNPTTYWLHTQVWNKKPTAEEWAISNNYTWFGKVEFFYLRNGKIHYEKFSQESSRLFPTLSLSLAPNESVDVYIKYSGVYFSILELHGTPALDLLNWERISVGIANITVFTLVLLLLFGTLAQSKKPKETRISFFVYIVTATILVFLSTGVLNAQIGRPLSVDYGSKYFVFIMLTTIMGWLSFKHLISGHFSDKKWDYTLFVFALGIMVSLLRPIDEHMTILAVAILFCLPTTAKFNTQRFTELVKIRPIIFGYLALHSTILITVAVLLGWINHSPLILHLFPIGFLCLAVAYFSYFAFELIEEDSRRELRKEVSGGNLAPTEMNSLQSNSNSWDTVYHEVTIMFVDIVGFSITSNLLGDKATFNKLTDWSEEIRNIIEKHNGQIDRSLGDGLLAFFGFNERSSKKHTREAFHAAQEIQRLLASRLAANQSHFPCRIGLNTAKVVIGDLNQGVGSDYTMIGDGVNFAARLETSSNIFKILMSEATLKHLSKDDYKDNEMHGIHLKIKHSKNFIKCYQYNPFGSPELRELLIKAEKEHFKSIRQKIQDPRYKIDDSRVRLYGENVEFLVLNFSERGFGVIGNKFFSPKSILNIRLSTGNDFIDKELEQKLLLSFNVEVKWSRVSGGQYKHGLTLKLTQQQKEFIFEIFQDIPCQLEVLSS